VLRTLDLRSPRNCRDIVDVVAPKRSETESDSVCGTGGFLLAAQIPFDRLPSPAILRSGI
jgi:hypothetical protein